MVVIPIRARTLDELLERIASHLVVLLNKSDDPEGDMDLVLSMLDERELWSGSMDAEDLDRHGSPASMPLLSRQSPATLFLAKRCPRPTAISNPLVCDTVEEPMSNVIPY